jgi:hypothetical protein
VEFSYILPSGPLQVTLVATVVAILLLGLLVFLPKKTQTPVAQ